MEPRIGLDVAEILVYSIALLLLIVMVTKISHWGDFSGGWVALMFLCLIRIIGAGTSIGDIATNTPGNGRVRSIAAASHGIGFALLLYAMAHFIHAALSSMFQLKTLQTYFIAFSIPTFITAILSGFGAGRIYARGPEPSNWQSNDILKAAAIIYAILGAVQVLVTIYLLMRHKKLRYRERRTVIAIALSLPFAVAANVYLVTTAFAGPSAALSPMSNTSTGVLICGLFTLIPDTAILAICYWTGCVIRFTETNPQKVERMQLEGAALTPGGAEREAAAGGGDIGRSPAYVERDADK